MLECERAGVRVRVRLRNLGSYGGLGRRRAQGRVVRAIGGGREARKVAK